MTNEIKTRYQSNETIEYEQKFDNKFSLSSGTKEPLTVVTIRLQEVKKHRSTIISGLPCLWYNKATDSMIQR